CASEPLSRVGGHEGPSRRPAGHAVRRHGTHVVRRSMPELPRVEPDDREHTARIGRGVFLATVAGGLTSLVWGKAAWSRLSGVVSPVAGQVAPFLPTSGWRIYTISGSLPGFDPASWRLEVGGLVAAPTSLSYDELRALPRSEQVSTFHCVTGW